MKAVLVIDKPKNCYECNLCAEEVIYGKTEFVCKGYESIIESLDGNDWCPLRSLPQKKVGDDLYERYGSWTLGDEKEASYRVGFNDCIDEITGEAE